MGSDGKHDTLTSQVRIDFRKFSEVDMEQTVILRLETVRPGGGSGDRTARW